MSVGLGWSAMLRAGLRDLRLRPAEFWALCPVELMLMLGLDGGSAPMARTRLEELTRSFPDTAAPPRQNSQTGETP
jgi:uncharacterized phage protein (TIGR02216 family)